MSDRVLNVNLGTNSSMNVNMSGDKKLDVTFVNKNLQPIQVTSLMNPQVIETDIVSASSRVLETNVINETPLLEANLQDIIVVDKGESGGTNDYQKLINKPSINGTKLYDNYNEIDPTVPDWAKKNNKPGYTAGEVGAVDANNELAFEEIDRMFDVVFGSKKEVNNGNNS